MASRVDAMLCRGGVQDDSKPCWSSFSTVPFSLTVRTVSSLKPSWLTGRVPFTYSRLFEPLARPPSLPGIEEVVPPLPPDVPVEVGEETVEGAGGDPGAGLDLGGSPGGESACALTPLVADGEVGFGAANVRVTQPGPPESALFHILNRAARWPSRCGRAASPSRAATSLTSDRCGIPPWRPSRHSPATSAGPRCTETAYATSTRSSSTRQPAEPADWARWIRPELVRLASVTGGSVTGCGGGVTVDLGDDRVAGLVDAAPRRHQRPSHRRDHRRQP